MADQKNLFLAVALSIVILITWNVMVEQPKMEKERIALEQQQAAQQTGGKIAATPGAPATSSPLQAGDTLQAAPSGPRLGSAPSTGGLAAVGLSREDALKKVARLKIDTQRLQGSISLVGARIDDLTLKDYLL